MATCHFANALDTENNSRADHEGDAARNVVVLFRRGDHLGDRLRGRGRDQFDLDI